MGYKTASAERSQATSAVSSAIAAFNNPDGTGFALTSTALTADKELKQYTVVAGTDPVNSATSVGGATITAVAITDSNYTVLDDTALATTGGYIELSGTGFKTGCIVYVAGTAATTTTFVSATKVRAAIGANSSNTLTIYLVNTDGSAAFYLTGLVVSGVPAWSTGATLTAAYEQAAYTQSLSATGDATISYSLKAGSNLPSGVTLDPVTGALSGTTPADTGSTTYTFTIIASDGQNQDTERLFSLTVNTNTVTWTSPAAGTAYELGFDVAMGNVSLQATSASGSAVTYTANTLPTGVSLTGNTIFGTPTVNNESTSTLLTATNSTRSATRLVSWVVIVAVDTYFSNTALLLTGNGTNGATNSTFIDSSTNAGTVTRSGTPNQGSFSPYSPTGYSVYFDGTGDYLTTTGFGLPTNFTLEFWSYLTAQPSGGHFTSASSIGPIISLETLKTILGQNGGYFLNPPNDSAVYPNGVSPLNQWNHWAVVRSSGTITFYLNGIKIGSSANSTDYTASQTFGIGAANDGSPVNVPHYMSNFRFSSVARYSGTSTTVANFTLPTANFTSDADTIFLGLQSNRFKDSGPNNRAITRNGDAKIQAFSPFPPTAAYSPTLHGGSAYFKPSNNVAGGDYLIVPASAAAFGTGDFTIELWSYIDATGFINGGALFQFTGANGTFVLRPENNTYWRVTTPAGQINYTTGGTFFLNQWMHHAVVRNAGTVYYYQNGVLLGSIADGTNYAPTTFNINNYAQYGAGDHISDFRVVLGTAVYTSAFTPPVSALTAITNTSLLLSFTNAGIIDATTKNNFLIEGQVSVSTTAPKFGTGSIYFGSTAQNNKLFGPYRTETGNFGTRDFTIEYWFKSVAGRGAGDLLGWLTTTNGYGNWAVVMSGGTVYFQDYYAGANVTSANANALLDNQWHHFAFVRYSGVFKIYFDGVSVASVAHTRNYNQPVETTRLVMGGRSVAGIDYGVVNAYIDDLRITKGVARYTTNFTPPTAALLR